MASGFFVLLEDVAALLDDTAALSKIATKKTAGILGDDLAVNANKASGFASSREIPVLWAIMKGSFVNKLIILPIAFILSAFVPLAIKIILLIGAVYLAYEGAEKLFDYFFPHKNLAEHKEYVQLSKEEILKLEKDKIKSAIFTDFILSIEIVIIALGTVLEEPLINQVVVVSTVAIIATIGVYGVVALIVRLDDFGFRLIKISKNGLINKIGNLLVKALPVIIRLLAVVGTIALLLVAGGIFMHYIHFLDNYLNSFTSLIAEFIAGLIVGIITFYLIKIFKKYFAKKNNSLRIMN
jgi:predicted DNA repair protein MutK